jgi:hypothetical protein
MGTIVIVLIVTYLLIGLVIYAVTDTRVLAGRMERFSLFISYGDIREFLFFLVVALWPVCLLMKNDAAE